MIWNHISPFIFRFSVLRIRKRTISASHRHWTAPQSSGWSYRKLGSSIGLAKFTSLGADLSVDACLHLCPCGRYNCVSSKSCMILKNHDFTRYSPADNFLSNQDERSLPEGGEGGERTCVPGRRRRISLAGLYKIQPDQRNGICFPKQIPTSAKLRLHQQTERITWLSVDLAEFYLVLLSEWKARAPVCMSTPRPPLLLADGPSLFRKYVFQE